MEIPSEKDEITFPGYDDINSYSKAAFRSILLATKSSNDLPKTGDDFNYYNSFQGFRALMFNEGKSILSLMTSLIKHQGMNGRFEGKVLEDKFDLLIDVNDAILENVANDLDKASGITKPDENIVLSSKSIPINTSWNKKEFNVSNSHQSCTLLAGINISRPQLKFKDKVDNSNTPFVPIITEKPNSIKPLSVIIEKDGDNEIFSHPYEFEIEKFNPHEEHLEILEPVIPKTLEETPLIFVKTKSELESLCNELKDVKEFAVDLEHHSYRSFQGFSCLMQISTRTKDYIIDVLELRSEMYILNEVFTNPKIVKVFHGADLDIQWLQRDFGIYVVNMFDTGQAARVLNFAHLSLSYLLKYYCKLDVDKKFQLADWRLRPLPNEMIKYAREDTHYLLYIYDSIKRDLVKNGNVTKNLLRVTFDRSKNLCLQKYEKPKFDSTSYLRLYQKSKKFFNPKQLFCLKQLYSWRDQIAREYDESIGYILPNHMMLQIAEALPREQQGILACCNPIPPFVLQNLNELHNIILKINESSLKQLEIDESQQDTQTRHVFNYIDLSNVIYCPHDIHHFEERNSHLPQKKSQTDNSASFATSKKMSLFSKKKPSLSVLFEKFPKIKHQKAIEKVAEIIEKLRSPFKRYEITKNYEISFKEDKKLQKTNEEHTNNSLPEEIQNSIERYTELPKNKDKQSKFTSSNSEKINSQKKLPTQMIEKDNEPIDKGGHLSEKSSIKELKSLRRERKKRKRKNLNPDISLETQEPTNLQNKKQRTPEAVVDKFQPFDYSQCTLTTLKEKKKTKKIEKNSSGQASFQTPHISHKMRRKKAKQATFGDKPNKRNKNWPSRQ